MMRKRSAAALDLETQRITHIAVERNRRRLINTHLHSLRSLIPPSFAQKGDQASIIGGVIYYVKELEQLLQSLLQLQSRHQNRESIISSTTINLHQPPPSNIIAMEEEGRNNKELGDAVLVEVVAIMDKHINLKVECTSGGPCRRRNQLGELVRVIDALEQQLHLTVHHLNITTTTTTTLLHHHHYSFSLKMEEGCVVRSQDEIVEAIQHIFS